MIQYRLIKYCNQWWKYVLIGCVCSVASHFRRAFFELDYGRGASKEQVGAIQDKRGNDLADIVDFRIDV